MGRRRLLEYFKSTLPDNQPQITVHRHIAQRQQNESLPITRARNKLYKQFQKITIKCQQYYEETHGLRDAAETAKQMECLTHKMDLTSKGTTAEREGASELILKNWIKS